LSYIKKSKPIFKDEWLAKDQRPPASTSKSVSKSMRGNIAKGTKPELLLRKALREVGLPGYRLNWRNAPGRPDISYPGRKVAIFVNGCYWHRCPYCKPSMPKKNVDYWEWKFARNKERDHRKRRELRQVGWKVFTFWECQLKKNSIKLAGRVKDYASGQQ
jgi:DNA mismatch endonuclease (patch repair protein)